MVRLIEPRFFDTSALLRLVLEEPGSTKARAIARDWAPVYTSWLLVGEALGVLKDKWRKKLLSEDQYAAAVFVLLSRIESDVKVVDLATAYDRPVLEINQHYIHEIRQRHTRLDAADAIQLALILRGIRGTTSASLVAADATLLRAAQEEGIATIPVNNDDG